MWMHTVPIMCDHAVGSNGMQNANTLICLHVITQQPLRSIVHIINQTINIHVLLSHVHILLQNMHGVDCYVTFYYTQKKQ